MSMRGVFLEDVRLGRRICTTREALLRLFTDLAELDEHHPPARHFPQQERIRTELTRP